MLDSPSRDNLFAPSLIPNEEEARLSLEISESQPPMEVEDQATNPPPASHSSPADTEELHFDEEDHSLNNLPVIQEEGVTGATPLPGQIKISPSDQNITVNVIDSGFRRRQNFQVLVCVHGDHDAVGDERSRSEVVHYHISPPKPFSKKKKMNTDITASTKPEYPVIDQNALEKKKNLEELRLSYGSELGDSGLGGSNGDDSLSFGPSTPTHR